MEAKQAVRDLLDKLPDDCTLDDVLYHLYVLQRLSQGLAEAESGQVVPHAEVERQLRQRWLLGGA
jgi:predicted transcriptional regulator